MTRPNAEPTSGQLVDGVRFKLRVEPDAGGADAVSDPADPAEASAATKVVDAVAIADMTKTGKES